MFSSFQFNKQHSKYFILTLATISTILILNYVLKYSFYGFDFSDEGIYLNWISNPFVAYKGSNSLYGFIYHPLYLLVDGNIALLRATNFVITFSLSWCLVCNFLLLDSINKIKDKAVLHVISSGIATSSFLFTYIQTPSYNHLTLQSLIVVCIGFLLLENKNSLKQIFGSILISLGIWITFLAKPSSAIAIVTLSLFYFFFINRLKFRIIIPAFITGAVCFFLTAIVIDGSIILFFRRIFLAYQFSIEYNEHSLLKSLRIDGIKNIHQNVIKTTIYIFTFSVLIVIANLKATKLEWLFSLLISLFLFFFIYEITFLEKYWRLRPWGPTYGKYQTLLVLSIVFSGFFIELAYALLKKDFNFGNYRLFIFFLIMPFIFAFGTNNNYWQQAGIAGVFWIVSGLSLIIHRINLKGSYFTLIPIVMIVQFIVSTHLESKYAKPYRDSSYKLKNKIKIEVNNKKHYLIISKEYSSYILKARKIAESENFKFGDLVLNFSHNSAGLVHLLGGSSLHPDNIGTNERRINLASARLKQTSCKDISRSWILMDPTIDIKLVNQLTKSLGIDILKNYKKIGSFKTPKGAGGHIKIQTQELYKPINSVVTLNSCNILKK